MTTPAALPAPPAPPGPAIRRLRWWDIPAVAALERVLFPDDSPWTEAMFWSELAAGHHYVAWCEDVGAAEPAGGALVPAARSAGAGAAPVERARRENIVTPAAFDGEAGGEVCCAVVLGYAGVALGPDDADVQTIGVAPAAQGRGIGRALLRNLLRAAAGRAVHLEVRTDNARAIALYESEGFVRIGVRRRYYQPSGADAYTMRRPPTG